MAIGNLRERGPVRRGLSDSLRTKTLVIDSGQRFNTYPLILGLEWFI